jgi:hypothetical protein
LEVNPDPKDRQRRGRSSIRNKTLKPQQFFPNGALPDPHFIGRELEKGEGSDENTRNPSPITSIVGGRGKKREFLDQCLSF